jgi:hypothetical protein
MATMLARTFKSTIYMVTLRRENHAAEKSSMMPCKWCKAFPLSLYRALFLKERILQNYA